MVPFSLKRKDTIFFLTKSIFGKNFFILGVFLIQRSAALPFTIKIESK